MESKIIDGLLIFKVNMLQAVALAVVTYYIGLFIRRRVGWMTRLSIPAPVVGGLLFSGLAAALRLSGVVGFDIDGTLQSALMILFFTTVGMGASLVLLKRGGLPLVIFFGLAALLAVCQNGVGIFLADLTGLPPILGLCAGSTSGIGGLGTAGAFGPLFESWGFPGAASAAIACATFGMVAGGLAGGPVAERLIQFHNIPTPAHSNHSTTTEDLPVEEAEKSMTGPALMQTLSFLLISMGLGSILSYYLQQAGVTLPEYIGAMIVAALIRNVGDLTGKHPVDDHAVAIISDIALAIFLTMAINGLKLWELIHLALPLLAIMAGQVLFITLYATLIVYRLMGRDYESAAISAGLMGFGLGATPNALVNIQTLAQKYGPAPKAFFIVSLVGAFLIDFANSIIITTFGNFLR